jgi:hypothetical protein
MALSAAEVLAGPILRRVEPGLVAVWVALARPAAVRLEVFVGQGRRQDLDAALPARPTADGSFENRTLAVGAGLHVALAVFEPQPPTRLDWGLAYSYELVFDDGNGTVDLDGLGLLNDQAAIAGPEAPFAHLALGYEAGVLPAFVMPPAEPKDLRVAHASCRGHALGQRDAMALLDELVADARLDPSRRLHHLLLTGDQVYADAVSPEQLLFTNRIATRLLGGGDAAIERIPVDLALDPATPAQLTPTDVPVDLLHLPASRRTHLINDLGGGTSTEADSHTLGFGEAAALYLTAWAPTLWPDLKAQLAERWQRVDDFRQASRQLLADARARLRPDELDSDAWAEHGGPLRERLLVYEAWRLLPEPLRAIDAHLNSADRAADWLPADDPAPAPAAATYHWPNFWSDTSRGAPDPARVLPPASPAAPAPSSSDAVKAALARAMTPSWYAGRHAWFCTVSYDSLETPGAADPVVADSGRTQLARLQAFLDDLPRVRRVLANVPTLMQFDDHEVTDDWNISARWARQTYGSSLGRAMVRNLLCAYALFQHWGNDPVAFRDPARPPFQLLQAIQRLFFSPGGDLLDSGPPTALRAELDTLLDLRRPDAPPTPSDQRMTWHYRWRGAQHELIVLDSRTWRTYLTESEGEIGQPASDLASAALISDESLVMQIPDAPEPGSVVTLVVASAPFIGMPVAENIVQPTLNASDSVVLPAQPPFIARQRSARVGRMRKDPEPFGFVPRLFEAMLARLANRRRIVLFSGDVHYSLALAMSYWRLAGTPLQARFVQMISSSVRAPRNQGNMELFTMDLVQQLGALTARQSRLGWVQPGPGEPPILPGGDETVSARIRRLLTEDPVMLPADGLPAGTATAPVQWAWRMALLADTRPDADRRDGLDPPTLQATLEADPQQAADELARRHRWQSEHMPVRRWQWWTNVCTVDFAADEAGALSVRQHVYARDVDGVPRRLRDRLRLETSLEVADDEPVPAPGAG